MEKGFYATLRWRAARAAALARDEYSCRFPVPIWDDFETCNETKNLHVHHICSPEEGGDPYDLENLMTVCASHHAFWHNEMRRWAKAPVLIR